MDWQGRQHELARLDSLARRGGFGVLWGRRRVGKTRLLVEWVERHRGAYFVADESSSTLQRHRFAEAVSGVVPGFAEVEYRDWGTLLTRLARESERAGVRGPFVIDELPYLVMASPELPSMLQRFLDHEARRAKLTMVVAGSSQRMMQGLVLDREAPLFGRASESFEVKPLAAKWLGPALGLRSAHDIVSAWNVWGGMPRYWELAADHPDRRSAVDALVLDPRDRCTTSQSTCCWKRRLRPAGCGRSSTQSVRGPTRSARSPAASAVRRPRWPGR